MSFSHSIVSPLARGVPHHPSCSSTMNKKSGAALLQISKLGLRLCASKVPRSSAGALTCLPHVSPHTLMHCSHSYSSNVKVRSYLQYIKHKIISSPSPPYSHVCQVGDPVLRSHAAAVDPAAITGSEIQKVINTMVKVMRRFECVGLSAPQIGVPLRILALEYPEKMLKESSPASRELRGLSVQPLRIFVNPQLRILDGRTVLFQEACESITGFSAAVPRYLSVEVSGRPAKSITLFFLCNSASEIGKHMRNQIWFSDPPRTKTFEWSIFCRTKRKGWEGPFVKAFLYSFLVCLHVQPAGLNEKGEAVSWEASGWPARIAQHEMDHLNGVLYVDRMDSKTFININWQALNEWRIRPLKHVTLLRL